MTLNIFFRDPVEERFLQYLIQDAPPYIGSPNHEAYAIFWAVQKSYHFQTRQKQGALVNADMVVQLAVCVNIALMEIGENKENREIKWNDYSGAMNHMFGSFVDSIILAVKRNELKQETDGHYLNLLLIPDWFIEYAKKADWIDKG